MRDYYVAPNGRDTNAGTIDAPVRSIQKAMSVIQDGDTVYLRAGDHRINFPKSQVSWTSVAPYNNEAVNIITSDSQIIAFQRSTGRMLRDISLEEYLSIPQPALPTTPPSPPDGQPPITSGIDLLINRTLVKQTVNATSLLYVLDVPLQGNKVDHYLIEVNLV